MKANVNIARFVKVLDDADQKGTTIPGLLMSRPGFGKTSTIRKYCEAMDYNLVTLIPSQSADDDILGIQSVKEGRMVRLTPSWYDKMVKMMENGKRTLLFIDEISTCSPWIQGPLLDLIFSHNLGDVTLPDNVFVVAAGNYADDLNNNFRMSSPLINRFMILNIWNDDFNVSDFINDDFESLSTPESIQKFLGLAKEVKSKAKYSFENIKKWIAESGEVGFGKSEVIEDGIYGLLGFTSVRSLGYSLKFISAYTTTYNDNLWMRVVGDTLGVSARREGKHLREIFMGNASKFMSAIKKSNRTLEEICKEILNSADVSDDQITELEGAVTGVGGLGVSAQAMSQLVKISGKYRTNPRIRAIGENLRRSYEESFR